MCLCAHGRDFRVAQFSNVVELGKMRPHVSAEPRPTDPWGAAETDEAT